MGVDERTLSAVCRKWKVAEMAVFGSALRADFDESSDVDVLVSFEPGSKRSLWDIIEMEDDLRGLLRREVDLVERKVIERSENYIRREDILSTAQVVYAA